MKKSGQAGKTTTQIQTAPKNSIYIWCNSNIEYPKHLAKILNRGDIVFQSPSFASNLMFIGLGNNVVVDHMSKLSQETKLRIRLHNQRVVE